jgi:hypothetical protein
MKNLIKNISLLFVATLVVFLSIGFSLSQMSCSEGGTIYIGTEVPSCSESLEINCEQKQEKVSCCLTKIEKTCCPETKDNTCNSDTENLHFEFETIVSDSEHSFIIPQFISPLILRDLFSVISSSKITYFSGIPPPKLLKPDLPKIQSFLL